MHTPENTPSYRGQDRLSIMAGWQPQHRSLEAEAAELVGDMAERDTAARVTFQRRAAQ